MRQSTAMVGVGAAFAGMAFGWYMWKRRSANRQLARTTTAAVNRLLYWVAWK